MKGEALFGVPRGRAFGAWGDGDAESTRAHASLSMAGRSMIEMLGVLAIIGVLSAGGIFAYSTAMENYKVNQTIKDISTMTANVGTVLLNNRRQEVRQDINRNQLYALGLIPEMYKNAKSHFNTTADVYYSDRSRAKALAIYIYNVPKSACIKLTKYDWTSTDNIMQTTKGKTPIQISKNGTIAGIRNKTSSEINTLCENNEYLTWWMHYISY